MKGTAISLILALAVARGYVVDTNKNGCPTDSTIEKLLEHEYCNKFYQCLRGELVEHTCPKGLLFNIGVDQCDWSENVDCGNRVITDDEHIDDSDEDESSNDSGGNCDPSEAPIICATKGSDGVLIAHENCNQFYKCSEGEPIALFCPENLLYNPKTEQCDWPQNVQCGNRVIPEDNESAGGDSGGNGDDGLGVGSDANNSSCNCNPAEATSICAAEGSEGQFIAHENCNQLYKCCDGKPQTMTCPTGLLYNAYLELCDWPQNVECGDRVIPESNGNGDGGSSGGDSGESGSEGGGGSVDGGNGDSGNDNNNTCNCNPEEAPTICAAEGSEGEFVAHENCNQFYKCCNGKPLTMTCPAGLFYNAYIELCDWPQNVQCGDRVIPEDNGESGSGGEGIGGGDTEDGGGNGDSETEGDGEDNNNTCNCNPAEAPSICAAKGSEGILVAHENCNQFSICSNGLPVVQSCPINLLYNPYTERCDWPENVQCGDRVIPGNGDSGSSVGGGGSDGESGGSGDDSNNTCNCNPGEAPSICALEKSEGVFVAHVNCNQFYTCNNGLPVVQSCPVNLLYNPYTERCDWPENVQCGDRVIPEDSNDGDSNSSGEESGGGGSGGGDSESGGGNGDGGSGGGGSDNNNTCNCNPGEAPSICAVVGSEGILVAHENCNQFYTCSNGLPVVQSCPANLLYNPYTEQCDWPENVQCGDRVIPEDVDNGDSGSGGEENGGDGSGGGDSEDGVSNGDSGSGGSGSDNNNTCNCNPGEAPSICAVEGSGGILVAHENCNQFYTCSNGLPVVQSCPVNLLYNPYTEQCDWPDNVQCGDRVIPEDCDDGDSNSSGEESGGGGSGGGDSEDGGSNGDGGSGGSGSDNNNTCNCNPGEAPSICAVEGSEGILVAHENCNQFYKCSNGLPVIQSCPVNLLYNPYTEQCDWPENVQCGDRVIPEDGDNGDSGSGGEENGGDGSGGGDSEDGGSNGDSGSGGSGSDNNNTCNCNPGEAPSICAVEGSGGILVAHENCNQFYTCSNGLPVVQSCPVNLLYNPYTEQCDWPENVQCGDRVIPEDSNDGDSNSSGEESGGGGSGGSDSEGAGGNGDGGSGGSGSDNNNTCNCNPGEAPSICAVEGSEGVLVAHENCNQFYKCSNGLPVIQSCPVNLLYNPYTEQCDWPENVQCGDRVIPEDGDNGDDGSGGEESGSGGSEGGDSEGAGGNGDGGSAGSGSDNNNTCNCNPGEAPSICAVVGSEGILVAHENCNQFYTCSNGLPVVQSCPVNLLYNPYTEQCDWPENVQCGDRVIPEDSNDGDSNSSGEESGGGGSGGSDSEGAGGNGDGGSGGSGSDNNNTCNCNPGEAPSICAVEGSEGILVAHENCNQFYKCSNGLPVIQSCPVNLLYNPYTEQCDWPENVQCGDRVIPEDGDNGDSGSGGEENGGDGSGGGDSEDGGSNGDSGSGGSGNDNNNTCNCNPGEAPSICAAEGSGGILVAHENCNQFYTCSNGLPLVQSCPVNLLYNPYTEQCDWPDNVQCGDRVIPEDCDDGDSNSSGEESGGGGSGGGDSEDGGSNGDGGSGGSGSDNNNTCNCNPGEAPSICAVEGSEGILVAHENCNQFYKCSNGLPVIQSCPVNLLYNPYTEQCDWPENVQCGDRVIPEDGDNGDSGSGGEENGGDGSGGGDSEDGGSNGDSGSGGSGSDNNNTCNCNPGEAPSICAVEGSGGILVAHENCNQFYTCSNGLPVVQSCPVNLLYNPYTEQCDWPENVQCGDRVIPEDSNDGDSNSSGEESGGGGSGGSDSEGAGGNGDGGSGGSGSDNNNTCNCNPGEAPSICAVEGSEGALVAHENCNQFYKCSNGLPVIQSCPVNLLYNPYTEQCDWPENVQCGDRLIPEDGDNGDDGSGGEESGSGGSEGGDSEGAGGNGDGGSGGSGSDNNNTCNCNPGEAPSICAVVGSEGILVAHENCNQFYTCSNGLPVVQSCPVNLLYNPYTEQCDWPENVQCGDRVIPEDSNDGDSNSSGEESGGGGSGGSDSEGAGGNGDGGSGGSGSDNNNTCNCNPGEAPSICAVEGSEGILVAHENCNQFYKCSNGLPVIQSCPVNLLYNPYTEQCDWPENVQCGDRVIPEDGDNGDSGSGGEENGGDGSGGGDSEDGGSNGDSGSGGSGSDNNNTCNCNPGEAPSICAAEGSGGILVAHENCNQFYTCSNGLPVVQSCPVNLLYNPYTEQCDWPENVQCGDRVIPEDSNDGDSNSSGEESGGGGSGGSDSEGAGGNGDGGSGGSGSDNNNTCNCNPGEAPSICAVEGSEGVLVAHENCNQFYKCSNGLPVIQSCPVNLLYNPYTEQCDWPENVQCGDRVIPEDGDNGDDGSGGEESGSGGSEGGDSEGAGGNGDGGSGGSGSDNNNTCNCNPGEAPSICAVVGSEGILVAHENCNQFYTCSNGLPVVQSCPVNLLYNPYTEQCDWPENVQCGDRVIPEDSNDGDSNSSGEESGGVGSGDSDSEGAGGNGDGGDNNNTCNCNPGEAPSICAVEGSEGVLVAHENCNQFYKCSNGLPVIQSCPVNLLYNPYTEQCDWPENVQCGDRVIPEDGDNGDSGSGGEESGSGGSGGGDSEGAGGNGDGGSGGSGSDNNNTCNCNPGEAPSICAVVGSEGILVAHENCNQFYTCINGLPVVQSCPVNLLYNPYTEQCDWPDNVQCGDRVIPEDSDNGDDGSGGEESGSGGSGGGDSEGAGGNGDGGSGGSGSDNNNTCNCNPGEAPSICAVVGSEGILVAHENCNQFYTCINGLPVVQSCPVNLLYNPYTEQCDWPDNVQCGDRVIPEDCDDGDSNSSGEESVGGDSESGGANGGGESEGSGSENNNTCNCNPGEAPSICAVEGSEGILVAHENCNQFYTCSNGLPLVQSCPVNLLYNPYTEQCDWPDNVQCGDRVIPEDSDDGDSNSSGEESVGGDSESGGGNGDGISGGGGSDNNNTCNCDPGEAPTICAADGSEGILVAHENCNQFYICSNGLPVVQSCPVNLLYNPYTEQCDWPANVQCGDRVITEDCGNGDSGSDGGENEGGDSGSESGDSDNNNTCNCNPRKAPSICAVEGSEGVLVAHENCNQFYTCSNGLPVVQNCPVNLLYNPYTERCDWPDKVDCGNRIISDNEKENNGAEDIKPESGNSDPSKAPAICATEGSDGVLIAHEICNQFYKCYEGIPVVFNCSPNLLYNPVHEWCDWAQNVDCGDRIQ